MDPTEYIHHTSPSISLLSEEQLPRDMREKPISLSDVYHTLAQHGSTAQNTLHVLSKLIVARGKLDALVERAAYSEDKQSLPATQNEVDPLEVLGWNPHQMSIPQDPRVSALLKKAQKRPTKVHTLEASESAPNNVVEVDFRPGATARKNLMRITTTATHQPQKEKVAERRLAEVIQLDTSFFDR